VSNQVKKRPPVVSSQVKQWANNSSTQATDVLIEEAPIALVYNGISYVVMMASPTDLNDFALGFSLTESIIQQPDELREIDIIEAHDGIELRLTISSRRLAELKNQRRNLTGRTGCGLCGAESLAQAVRPLTPLSITTGVTDHAIQHAVHQLQSHQPLQSETGACHAAVWCQQDGQAMLAREDVGRHNALDKLIGSIHKNKINRSEGFALISSRASYEMVHKAVSAGINTLVAVSAPTSLAVKLAKKANLTLIGFARSNRHVYYTNFESQGEQRSG
jgi:FdhD protein